jgi:hypothetical protein
MMFSFTAIVVGLALFSSPSVSTDAFAPKHPRAFQPRGIVRMSTTISTVAEVPTTPIKGMKPGTSGLRKKVEVWQGKEGDKNYVENFIQSLIDTATEKNGDKVPET